MKRFYNFITRAADLVGVVSLGCMTVITIIAVFWRYMLNSALPWPEEMTRYFFILATYMGISVVMESDEHLKMEVLATILGKSVERLLKVVYLAVCLVFFGCLVLLSWDMMQKVHRLGQSAVAFPFPLWIVWAGMVISFVLTTIQAARRLVLALKPDVLSRDARRS